MNSRNNCANPLHGHQEGRFFHGYYDCYCYLPLYIFCDRHLLAAKLRRSNIASPIHYQFDPVQTTKTSVIGAINMLGLAKRLKARIFQAST
jgi:DDE family transposase